MNFFGQTRKALFVSRPNRFVVVCELDGRKVRAFLPNPGRLLELLLPGTPVYLEEASPDLKLPYTAVAAEREGHRVVLHTLKSNQVARHLIQTGAIPALRGFVPVRSEVVRGNSRFDFLLRKGDREMILEVKSCTLFSRRSAMFPDAVTERGRRHLEELARLSSGPALSAVLFIIHWPGAEVFMPDFHTDLAFARTLLAVRGNLTVLPVALAWKNDLTLDLGQVRVLDILWDAVEKEAHDRGSYLVVLRLPQKRRVYIGSLGDLHLQKGFYIYVGSAMRALSARIERHRRTRKKCFWHIDYLREQAEFHAAMPIRSKEDLECEIAASLHELTGFRIPGFGSSDCSCPSHLFYTPDDPLTSPHFHAFLQQYRMERVVDRYWEASLQGRHNK